MHDYYVDGWSVICGWGRWFILSQAAITWAHDPTIVAWVKRMKDKSAGYT